MAPILTAGLICLGIGFALFLVEVIANRKGFGQLVAVMRTTVLVIGVVLVAIGLIKR